MTSAPNARAACAVSYRVINRSGGGIQASVSFKNRGRAAYDAWQLTFTAPGDQAFWSVQGGVLSQNGSAVSISNRAGEGSLASGAEADMVLFAKGGSAEVPTDFAVNGAPCTGDPATESVDEQLLNEAQEATFRYFWDFAHPASGMTRERATSNDLVTTGGSGFGIQSIVVGVHRGWISRQEAVARLNKISDFLATADRFHGAWSHWIDGNTGRVIPFSPKDDGGDLIETAFLVSGLLTARAYFNGADADEAALREKITRLWETVEWSWYASQGDDNLYWHWSPTNNWDMNVPIRGWNEGLIAYVLALSSPTHPISPTVYRSCWLAPGFENHQTYEGYSLDIGPALGGPLFFAHYSFLGLDPRKMQDQLANYWQHNVKHTLVNRSYSLNSAPTSFGYSPDLWGLTASDDPDGYSAHNPTNDNGTIAPTAALSSFPYTPYYSMQVLRRLYGDLRAQMVGTFGPFDAYNMSRGWVDGDYLAIDQGPIVIMMENYRSGLLWDLFSSLPEIQAGLALAGINDPEVDAGFYLAVPNVQDGLLDLLKHPDMNTYLVDVAVSGSDRWTLQLLNDDGTVAERIWRNALKDAGRYRVSFGSARSPGVYQLRLRSGALTRDMRVNLH